MLGSSNLYECHDSTSCMYGAGAGIGVGKLNAIVPRLEQQRQQQQQHYTSTHFIAASSPSINLHHSFINDPNSTTITMKEFDDNDNDTVIPDDFREVHELSTVDVKTSNWKGTLISILVILFLSSVIILAIYIINPDIQYKLYDDPKEKLKLAEFLDGNYTSQSTFNGTWISDTEIAFIKSTGEFVLYDATNNNTTIIIFANVMKQHDVERAILSPNRKYVLFVSHIKNIFRHSTTAQYKIYNLLNNTDIDVKPEHAQKGAYLQAAEWGPKDAQLTFVYKNNIYYLPEPTSQVVRISNNEERYIYNGIPDWIYEEEILATGTAFWWSKDGTRLAYAQFNDTEVELQEYPWYGDNVNLDSQYLDPIRIKYPKPGNKNPTVKLFVVKLNEDFIPKEVEPPYNLTNRDYYLTSVSWADQNTLLAVWLTREQNYCSYSVCSPMGHSNWECIDNLIQQKNHGWIEISNLYVDARAQNYYVLYPDRTRYQHVQIIRVNIKTGEKEFITSGRRDVTKILKITGNDLNNIVYYMATRPDKPGERHAYSQVDTFRTVSNTFLNNNSRFQNDSTIKCYTCDQIELNQCLFNRVSFSHNAAYFIHECLGPNIPYSILRQVQPKQPTRNKENEVKDSNFTTRIWESNQNLKRTLDNKLLPTIKTEFINRTDTGTVLIVQMFMPPSFNPDRVVKYPLLVQVYAGPGSQNVNENFKMNFGKYLASSKDIIYAYIDGRGSGFQGETMKFYLYHKLGTVEIEDQIYVTRILREKYNFINRDAIGIWGWSYGGYATALVLANDVIDPVFACGISVAPVTSWLLYDSAYTERYMGIPNNETMKNYQTSDVMHLADKFKSKKFLLIHGTADDNVHIQNSMVLIKELNTKNVMFQTQIYPDENHGLPGVSAHLYNTMENFWNDCFQSDYFFEEIGLRRRRVPKYDNRI